jgi:hypothetical protein
MYVGTVPMFLFVVIAASVACERERRKKKERKKVGLFFSLTAYLDWL